MKRIAGLGLLALAACAQPHGSASVAPGGAQAVVDTGAVTLSGGSYGAAASVNVVETPEATVNLGTNGAAVALRPGGGPVSVQLGSGGGLSVGF